MFASAYFRENVHFYGNYLIPLIRTVSIITVFAMIIVQLTMQCPIAKKDLIKDSSNRQGQCFQSSFSLFHILHDGDRRRMEFAQPRKTGPSSSRM